MTLSRLFVRHFTKRSEGPYAGIKLVKRSSIVRDKSGEVLRKMDDIEVPEFWSQTATDMLAQKYLRKAGVPAKTERIYAEKVYDDDLPSWLSPSTPSAGTTFGGETSVVQVVDRLAGHWTYSAWQQGYFRGTSLETEELASTFFDEIRYMLIHQMAAPNSPQWFNTGLWWAYGITGENSGTIRAVQSVDGVWHVEEIAHSYRYPQVHACFIQGVEDDLISERGIFGLWTREARVFKFGGGSGSNFSNLRGAGEPLSGGGSSSGLLSFLKIGDRAAGSIKSGGTTRRAAKIVVVDDDHPDVIPFIRWKAGEEQKVAAMICGHDNLNRHMVAIVANGESAIPAAKQAMVPDSYIKKALDMRDNGVVWQMPELGIDYEGEAYGTVSGQNANNSVSVTNKFMNAVENDEWWGLKGRLDKKAGVERYRTKLKARELFREINEASWFSADPGLIFRDTMNAWNTCPVDGDIEATNPCGEYCFLNDTGCNLASINLLKFLCPDGTFDHDSFSHAARIWTTVLDVTVGMASYPSASIAIGSERYRTLGLGYANLGALLMSMGLPYDSDLGRMMATKVTSLMTARAYETSSWLAETLGTFPRYDANKKHVLRVIRSHAMCAGAYNWNREGTEWPAAYTPETLYPTGDFADVVIQAWVDACEAATEFGVRNAQVTLIAPTGTISLVMDCDTTGVEPDFAVVKFKKLAGGGYVKIVNQRVAAALEVLGYSRSAIDGIVAHMVGQGTIAGSPHGFELACNERGISDDVEEMASSSMDMRHLIADWQEWDYTDKQWNDINNFVCGTMTIEGAPYLRDRHLSVFDCANKCGRTGTRFIAPLGHIKMMACLTPLLSGSISKTVNLPESATVSDFDFVHTTSWKMGIKDVSCYRDTCKLNQPLSSSFKFDVQDTVAETILKVVETIDKGTRKFLPDRRTGFTQKVKIDNHKIYLRTGEYKDGSLGEIFIDMAKSGSQLRSWANSFAMAVSIGLQHGVPLDRFVESFVFTKFEPNGMVMGHERIRMCTSVIDMIFRELGITYLGRDDLAHISHREVADEGVALTATHNEPEGSGSLPGVKLSPDARTASDIISAVNVARMKGYEGEACHNCHQMTLVRSGVCLRCDTCGSTTGCS